MRLILHARPEREFVAVIVGVVQESALLHYESARVHRRRVTAIPAVGPLPGCTPDRLDCQANMLPLDFLAQTVVFDPAPAVTAYVEPGFANGGRRFGVALQRKRTAEHGHG